jgi:hypothetical protein
MGGLRRPCLPQGEEIIGYPGPDGLDDGLPAADGFDGGQGACEFKLLNQDRNESNFVTNSMKC